MKNGSEDTQQGLALKRHTLAHLLAAAVRRHYPDALPTIGPAVDNGFYYDFEFPSGTVPGTDDLKAIEKSMRDILPFWNQVTHEIVSSNMARDTFAQNQYKLELINDISASGTDITLYTSGPDEAHARNPKSGEAVFVDLCRGGHVENPSVDIAPDSFKLVRIAGAYWRGDEKNKMLTRIYGLAFDTKEELDAYILQQEEALKRDHRKIGKEQGLFVFSDLVGPGLPLWTPKGTIIREELQDFVWQLRKSRGYQKVVIPHITKQSLYEKSGHWDKYADSLFQIHTREDHTYAMKPMNCPHHTQIFDSEPRSYRDMPQRYCESTMVYRDEQSGELSGLARVLSITQDDAHVFCRINQIEEEVATVWDIISEFYSKFGFTLTPRLSRRDASTPDKYLGSTENWDLAEEKLRNVIVKNFGDAYIDGEGEAAFYGPKIDFMAYDAIGRRHQIATIQLDFVQPERFGLVCTNEQGEKEPIAMIHCAIMGSFERFLAVAIEHFAGAFPLWMSPVQIAVLPVSDKHTEYAQSLVTQLKAADVRVELRDTESLGKRIRETKVNKIPYVLVVGDAEVEANNATLEGREGKIGTFTIDEITSRLTEEIKTRKL
ncbi:MAG: thrS [Candidatus Kaiserbacteria bacterium]|nr:thrS [Candidatus Kaiserbacteria bacterium]